MKNLKLILPMLVILFTSFKAGTLYVQTVSGVVTDKSDGSPLPGVMVYSSVNKKSTMTDPSGRYSITMESAEKELRFTYLGYQTLVSKISGKELNAAMEQQHEALSEVVVVGYGSRGKSSSAAAPVAALSGKVAGLSIKSSGSKSSASRLADKSKAVKTDRIAYDREDRPQSNQLTAGEWNDLNHWNFWTSLMNNQEWSQQQSSWEFYTKKRISVQLQNKQQQPLSNYTVTASANGSVLWQALSNFEGKAELWPSLYSNSQQKIVVSVTDAEGEEVYRKMTGPENRGLTITLDRDVTAIRNLDVLFMVDATGSMGDEINYLKSELEDITGRLKGNKKLITRTALVFYRDHGDEYLIRDFGFDENMARVKQNLSAQHAGGGGDFEEAVDEAMENAIDQQEWTNSAASAKIMFMILDAPPHHTPEKIRSIQASVKKAAGKGIILIPVVASGIDKNTEFLMRFMAMATNGTYVFLTDDSGIGNSHLKPTTGSYEVEHLNHLLSRLIRKYAGLGPEKPRNEVSR